MSVLYILWLRQMKRYFRARSRIIGSIGQPLLYLFALGYGLGSVFQRAGQGNYLEFLVPGVISQTILFTAIFSGIEIIFDRQFGFLKETMVAPVSRYTIVLGRTLGGATVATLQGILVLVLSYLFGFRLHNWAYLPLILASMFLIGLMFTALGTAIASTVDDMQGFQLILNFLVLPLYFLSGALYPLNNLPSVLTIIAKINPLSYGVDSLRSMLIGVSHFGLYADFGMLLVISAAFLAIGSWLFNRIQA